MPKLIHESSAEYIAYCRNSYAFQAKYNTMISDMYQKHKKHEEMCDLCHDYEAALESGGDVLLILSDRLDKARKGIYE